MLFLHFSYVIIEIMKLRDRINRDVGRSAILNKKYDQLREMSDSNEIKGVKKYLNFQAYYR